MRKPSRHIKKQKKGIKMEKEKIVFELVWRGIRTNIHCVVCDGYTDSEPITCEASDGKHGDLRICEKCFKAVKGIDAMFSKHIADLEARAAYLESLKGRLEIPTHEAWRRAATEVATVYAANVVARARAMPELDAIEADYERDGDRQAYGEAHYAFWGRLYREEFERMRSRSEVTGLWLVKGEVSLPWYERNR